jgi:hypothetical protein
MDLIRSLLLKLEALPMEMGDNVMMTPDDVRFREAGITPDEIEYHLNLLREQDLIDCPAGQPMIGIIYRGLTWRGHDFLDSVRDEEVWRKTKKGAEAAGGYTVDILISLAKAYLKAKVREHVGIDI